MHFYDDVDFEHPEQILEEVKKGVEEYIKKSKPFYVMVSTKSDC